MSTDETQRINMSNMFVLNRYAMGNNFRQVSWQFSNFNLFKQMFGLEEMPVIYLSLFKNVMVRKRISNTFQTSSSLK